MDSDSQFFYDGGVAEYSTDGGTVWHDAVTLPGPTINGYNGTLRTGLGNPLAGRQAFSGASPGYETTRHQSRVPHREQRQDSIPSGERQLDWRVGMVHRRSVRVHVRGCPTSPNPQTSFVSLVPGRLLESRGGQSTVDGLFNGVGLRGAGSVTVLPVVGRVVCRWMRMAVVLNVTVTDPQACWFCDGVSVWECAAECVEFEFCGGSDGGQCGGGQGWCGGQGVRVYVGGDAFDCRCEWRVSRRGRGWRRWCRVGCWIRVVGSRRWMVCSMVLGCVVRGR